jgi:hypothetical protein
MKLTTYPCGGLGSRSVTGGSIHAAGRLSSFAASWPAVTNLLRASLVAVERGHDSGSMMVIVTTRQENIVLSPKPIHFGH